MNRKGLFSWSGFGGVVKGNPPGTTLQFTPFGRTFTGAFGYDGINTGLDVAGCTVVCAGAFMDIQVGDLYPHKVRGRGGPCGAACGLFCGWGCNYLKFGFSPKTVPANIAKKLPAQRCSKPHFIAFFSLSHKRPTFAFTGESGYTLGFRRRIAHSGLHAETGGVSDGGGITTLGAFRTFTNIPGPGIRTASFAAFGAWSGVLPKNAESLRNSDALMRVAAPKASRPRWAA